MTDRESTAEVWRALWASMEEGVDAANAGPPSAEELQALLMAASRLPASKLRLLIDAVRAAAGG
jgi:hypothetical protein